MRKEEEKQMSIKIDLKIFLFLLLFFLTAQLEMYLLLMAFAVIHELTHLILGLLLKFKPKELKLTPVGLQVEFFIQYKQNEKTIGKGSNLEVKKILIALAGPIMNFLIAIIIGLLQQFSIFNLEESLCQNIIYANFLIGLFNLIPIYPLDGGRILKEIIHIVAGLRKAEEYSYIISKTTIVILTIISSIAILYLQNLAIIIILTYLWILAIKEDRNYHTKEKIMELEKYFMEKEYIKKNVDIPEKY